MKTMIAKIKQAGATFTIPVQVSDDGEIFTKDVVPVINQQEDEDGIDTRFNSWYESNVQQELLRDEASFPQSYK